MISALVVVLKRFGKREVTLTFQRYVIDAKDNRQAQLR